MLPAKSEMSDPYGLQHQQAAAAHAYYGQQQAEMMANTMNMYASMGMHAGGAIGTMGPMDGMSAMYGGGAGYPTHHMQDGTKYHQQENSRYAHPDARYQSHEGRGGYHPAQTPDDRGYTPPHQPQTSAAENYSSRGPGDGVANMQGHTNHQMHRSYTSPLASPTHNQTSPTYMGAPQHPPLTQPPPYPYTHTVTSSQEHTPPSYLTTQEPPTRLPDLVPKQQPPSGASQLPPPPQLKPRPGLSSTPKSESGSASPDSVTSSAQEQSPANQVSSRRTSGGESSSVLKTTQTSSVQNSARSGAYAWKVIDGVNLPILLRGTDGFLSVRMVESKLLSKFPNTYPKGVRERPPLVSHYVSPAEANALNNINREHLHNEFGDNTFSVRDLIVKLEDFNEFYATVKSTFKEDYSADCEDANKGVDGGWVQINSTVVPYIFRENKKYVPLSVIRYAANLLTDVQVQNVCMKEEEAAYLNQSCSSVGLSCKFTKEAKLIVLESVRQHSGGLQILELPKTDPINHAQYNITEQQDREKKAKAAQETPVRSKPASDVRPQQPYNGSAGQPAQQQKARGAMLPPRGPLMRGPPNEHVSSYYSRSTHMPYMGNHHHRGQYFRMPLSNANNGSLAHLNNIAMQSYPTLREQHPNILSELSRPMTKHRAPPVHEQFKGIVQQQPPNYHPFRKQSRRLYPIIKSVKVEGQSLSSIIRDNTKIHYALLEAVCRVYFKDWKLQDFIDIVENKLKFKTYIISHEEEAAVIRFYGLKLKNLATRKLISVVELERRFASLKNYLSYAKSNNIMETEMQNQAMIVEQSAGREQTRRSVLTEIVAPIVIAPIEDMANDNANDDCAENTQNGASSAMVDNTDESSVASTVIVSKANSEDRESAASSGLQTGADDETPVVVALDAEDTSNLNPLCVIESISSEGALAIASEKPGDDDERSKSVTSEKTNLESADSSKGSEAADDNSMTQTVVVEADVDGNLASEKEVSDDKTMENSTNHELGSDSGAVGANKNDIQSAKVVDENGNGFDMESCKSAVVSLSSKVEDACLSVAPAKQDECASVSDENIDSETATISSGKETSSAAPNSIVEGCNSAPSATTSESTLKVQAHEDTLSVADRECTPVVIQNANTSSSSRIESVPKVCTSSTVGTVIPPTAIIEDEEDDEDESCQMNDQRGSPETPCQTDTPEKPHQINTLEKPSLTDNLEKSHQTDAPGKSCHASEDTSDDAPPAKRVRMSPISER